MNHTLVAEATSFRRLITSAGAIITLSLLLAPRLFAQLSNGTAPTVVHAKSGSSASPYTQSTTPLSDVPEGVTTYYWPTQTTQPSVAKKEYTPTSYQSSNYPPPKTQTMRATRSMPVQTTMRPAAESPPALLGSNGPCECGSGAPIGSVGPQTGYLPPGSYVSQNGYPPAHNYQPGYAYRPDMPVSQLPSGYYFGQGLIGQPKVYVPGQPVRNAIRYISP